MDFNAIRGKDIESFDTPELKAYFIFLSLLPMTCMLDSNQIPQATEYAKCANLLRFREIDATDIIIKEVKSSQKDLTTLQELQLLFTQRLHAQLYPELIESLAEEKKQAELRELEIAEEKRLKAEASEERKKLREQKVLEKEQKAADKQLKKANEDFKQMSLFVEAQDGLVKKQPTIDLAKNTQSVSESTLVSTSTDTLSFSEKLLRTTKYSKHR